MKKIIFIIFVIVSLVYAQKKFDIMTLKTIDNKTVKIQITSNGFVFLDYKNKVVLLDIFGVDCPYCIKSRQLLIEMQNKYQDKFQIIGVQVQGLVSDSTLEKFAKRYRMTYPIINREDAKELIIFIQINANWQGQIPYMLLFAKDGKLLQEYLGLISKQKLELDIKSSI